MTRYLFPTLVLSTLLGCGGLPKAASEQPVSVGVGLGTLGVTVEPSYRADPNWGVRVPVGFGTIKRDITVDGIDYAVSASTGGVGVMADYFPNGGNFRVSGGLMKSNLSSTGRATGTLDVGSGTYAGVDLRTEAEAARSIAPMVSFGYDGVTASGWGVSADLGAMYTGGFQVSVTDLSGTVPQSDIDAETASINDSLNDFKVIPYVKLGMTYRW